MHTERYLEPVGMSAIQLACHLNVPRTRIERLVRGEAGLSLDTARQLVKFFAMTEAFWIDLQRPHDFAHAWETRDRSGIKFRLSVDGGVTQYGD